MSARPRPRRRRTPSAAPTTRSCVWRRVPAPRRGEFVRLLGEELRAAKADLGRLVTLETGKILSEGLGEVQEMIDICDFAVGLSRQLYGATIATERPDHRMMETWHPLGVCGVISAFNFPVAVWSWNAALAFVCGDPVVWKPSEKTPLTALATQALVQACDGALRRRAGGPVRGADRRARDRRDPRRRPPRAGRLGDRLDRHGRARSGRGSRRALPAPSWSSAATTPRSSRPRPISTSRCAASPSRRWARPASAARRCAASSSMRASMTASCRASPEVYDGVAIGDPRAARHARRAADRPAPPSKAWSARSRRRGRPAARSMAAGASSPVRRPDAFYVQPGARRDAGPDRPR